MFETKSLFHSSFFAGEHKPSTVEADITALIFFPSSCQPYMQIAVTTTLVAPLVTGGLLSQDFGRVQGSILLHVQSMIPQHDSSNSRATTNISKVYILISASSPALLSKSLEFPSAVKQLRVTPLCECATEAVQTLQLQQHYVQGQ